MRIRCSPNEFIKLTQAGVNEPFTFVAGKCLFDLLVRSESPIEDSIDLLFRSDDYHAIWRIVSVAISQASDPNRALRGLTNAFQIAKEKVVTAARFGFTLGIIKGQRALDESCHDENKFNETIDAFNDTIFAVLDSPWIFDPDRALLSHFSGELANEVKLLCLGGTKYQAYHCRTSRRRPKIARMIQALDELIPDRIKSSCELWRATVDALSIAMWWTYSPAERLAIISPAMKELAKQATEHAK